MISLKKFLVESETEKTLLRVVQLLLQGLGQYAVEAEPAALGPFRESIQQVSEAFEEAQSPATVLVQAGSALRSLEDYNRKATTYLRSQNSELQSIVKMLTTTIGALSSGCQENVSQLHEIETQVELATHVDDVRQIKERLSGCLEDIRREVVRQRTESAATIENLTNGLDSLPNRPSGVEQSPTHDEVTRLPSRRVAEEELTKASRGETTAFAAAIVVERIDTFNTRFGHDVGDEIMRFVAGFLRGQIPAADQLFRWTGPAMVALMVRPSTVERARRELGRILEFKCEHTVKTASRTILIPISMRWTLFPVMASPRLLIHKIDSFSRLNGSPD